MNEGRSRNIYVLYSTDYELFLGENHLSEKEVLIDTSERLLRTCEEGAFPLNIFCDVACLWKYRELGRHEFPDLVERQLRDAVRRGHDVQTHLHPHWLFASPDGRGWKFADDKFRLGTLSADAAECESLATQYLAKAAHYFETLLKPIDPGYRCLAYRAGGYGLQPNEQRIFSALSAANYLIDSSIVPGKTYRTSLNSIDFSRVPREAGYWLSRGPGLEKSGGRELFEIPVGAGTLGIVPFLRHVRDHLKRRQSPELQEVATRGRGAQAMAVHSSDAVTRLLSSIHRKTLILKNRWVAMEDLTSPQTMMALTKRILQSHSGGDVFFSVNTHSKTMTNSLLSGLSQFNSMLKAKYGDRYQPLTFGQAAAKIASIKV